MSPSLSVISSRAEGQKRPSTRESTAASVDWPLTRWLERDDYTPWSLGFLTCKTRGLRKNLWRSLLSLKFCDFFFTGLEMAGVPRALDRSFHPTMVTLQSKQVPARHTSQPHAHRDRCPSTKDKGPVQSGQGENLVIDNQLDLKSIYQMFPPSNFFRVCS